MALAILFARNPDALLHASFWGEDGWLWYPAAARDGIATLVTPHTGYLQTIDRLVALASLWLPLAWAPTLFAAVALAIEPLIAVALVHASPPGTKPRWSIAAAAIYLLLPNSVEAYGNITNSQWQLALLAACILAAPPPRSRAMQVAQPALLVLSGLSGPFALFLLPPALLAWRRHRTGPDAATTTRSLAAVAATAAIQAIALIATAAAARPAHILGATLPNFARILASQVVAGGLLGLRITRAALANLPPLPALVLLVVAAAALALCVRVWRRGPPVLRVLMMVTAPLFTAILLRPVAAWDQPAWLTLARLGACQRYMFFPMLVFLLALLTLAGDPSRPIRRTARTLLACLPLGMAADFSHPAWPPTQFPASAARVAATACGTPVVLPIYPPGATMALPGTAGCR